MLAPRPQMCLLFTECCSTRPPLQGLPHCPPLARAIVSGDDTWTAVEAERCLFAAKLKASKSDGAGGSGDGAGGSGGGSGGGKKRASDKKAGSSKKSKKSKAAAK